MGNYRRKAGGCTVKGDKMKNRYTEPEMKIILLSAENILTTSSDKDPFVEDPFEVLA